MKLNEIKTKNAEGIFEKKEWLDRLVLEEGYIL